MTAAIRASLLTAPAAAPARAVMVKVRTPAAARVGPSPFLRSRSTPISRPMPSAIAKPRRASSDRSIASQPRGVDPLPQQHGKFVRLLKRRHVAAILDHLEVRVRQALGHPLGLLELAQPVLAAGDDQRRAGD